jgi:hypothetical protein
LVFFEEVDMEGMNPMILKGCNGWEAVIGEG